jgi:hypothetical protein
MMMMMMKQTTVLSGYYYYGNTLTFYADAASQMFQYIIQQYSTDYLYFLLSPYSAWHKSEEK